MISINYRLKKKDHLKICYIKLIPNTLNIYSCIILYFHLEFILYLSMDTIK